MPEVSTVPYQAVATALALAVIACGESTPTDNPAPDASDASTGVAGPDSGAEAGSDAGPDAVSDAADAGPDAMSDAADAGTTESGACADASPNCYQSCSEILDDVHSGACTNAGNVCPTIGLGKDLLYDLQACCSKKCAGACQGCPFSSHQFSTACTQCIGSSCVQETANCTANQYVECNPVSGSPCALLAGATCDVEWKAGEFVCWGGSNPQAECAACDYGWPKGGTFCAGGLTCVDATGQPTQGAGTCRRYCCTDADCGGAACQKGKFPWKPEVGLCTASCTGPKPAPSGGSCAAP
ncbi:MAG: hypothetical protein L6Q84_05585 [Polyangiaceae bacterium]|nr:hypothetical protein [Polyangiaceae bacterium]